MKDVPKGYSEVVNVRDIEYYLKCPLRHEFNRTIKHDLTPMLFKAIDQTISYSTIKLVTDKVPTLDSLKYQFMKRFKAKSRVEGSDSVLSDEELMEIFINKAESYLTKYHKTVTNIMERFTFQMPAFPVEFSNYGTHIEIIVHLVLKRRMFKKNVIVRTKPKYVIIDYSGKNTKSWNIFGKLWATAIKTTLMNKGITTIDVAILNIPTMKMTDIVMQRTAIGPVMLDNICKMYAARYVYPIFGGHCYSCFFQDSCSRATSY